MQYNMNTVNAMSLNIVRGRGEGILKGIFTKLLIPFFSWTTEQK